MERVVTVYDSFLISAGSIADGARGGNGTIHGTKSQRTISRDAN
jgi:hypothetical protein